MRKREYLGQLEPMVLLATIRPESAAYGVQICREISEKSGREVALASVYAALEVSDNCNDSQDSRFAQAGFVPDKNLERARNAHLDELENTWVADLAQIRDKDYLEVFASGHVGDLNEKL